MRLRALLPALIVLAALPASAGAASPGAPGLGDRLAPGLGNGGYEVMHYDLDLRYATNAPSQSVDGTVTILAQATQSLSRFNLDFGGESVGSVSVDGRSAAFRRDAVEANEKLGFRADQRDYGIGAQILRDLGVRRMRLMTNNPSKYIALAGYGLEILERVPLEVPPTDLSRDYLKTKREKLGHLLQLV